MPITQVKNPVIANNTIAPAKLNVTSSMQTFLSSATSANLAATIADETGSGSLVFGTAPTLTSPTISSPTINGSTGIGTSSPQQILTISGSSNINVLTEIFSDNASSGGILGLKSRGTIASPAVPQTNDNLFTFGGGGYNGTTVYNYNRAVIAFRAGETWSGSANGSYIAFETTTNGTTTRSERMRITGAGGISIGTTTDAGANNLLVAGTVTASNYNPATGVANFLATPTSANLLAAITDETGSGSLVFNTNPTFQGANVTGNLAVDTNTLFVDSTNDRVGIGTTSPNERLTVSGNISASGNANIAGDLTVDTNTLFVDSVNNRIGIGTSTPLAKLDVNGSVNIGSNLASFTGTYSLVVNDVYGGIILNRLGESEPFIRLTSNGLGGFQFRGLTTGGVRFTGINGGDEWVRVTNTGNVGIGTTTPSERLTVSGNVSVTGNISASGHFSAATKSFKIPHQTKEGYLQYGVVESNEHSVYVRGKTDSNIIELPEHWEWLVDGDSVTVQLTPIGAFQPLFVESCDNKKVTVGGNQGLYSYVVYGTRKDVAPLEIEIA